jgi:putative copper export protein
MTLSPWLRKLVLALHVTSSVGWLGSVAAFLALAVAGLSSRDVQTVRAAYVAMELVTGFIIVPLCLASVTTGLVQSLGTPWGLFRHYWVVAKLLLTVVATVALLLQTGVIGYLGAAAGERALASADLRELRTSMVVHAGGGLVVLLLTTVLSVYKPQGMTKYGQRRQRELRGVPAP